MSATLLLLQKKQISFLKILLPLMMLIIFSVISNAQNQTAKVTPAGVWYYEYVPPEYNSNSDKYPVVFFLHGLGERGNTESDLALVAKNGPPKYVKSGFKFPFILISPQLKTAGASWNPKYVDGVIEHCKSYLRIDLSRIYLTGLSMGGGGTWGYAQNSVLNQKIAAIAPVCGHQNSLGSACNIVNSGIPVWAFHGDADPTVNVSKTVNMVKAINACVPAPNPLALITIYPGVKHDSWNNAYRTDHSLHNPNVYEWLLQFKRGGVKVNAGLDISLNLPNNATNLVGSASTDKGSIQSYLWTRESGPVTTIINPSSSTASLTNLAPGIYTFRLTASNGTETSYDDVKVTVTKTNQAPVADAGLDINLTLPTNSVNIVGKGTDTDGTIKSYLWSRVSGPSGISNQSTATLSLNGLIAGTYIFSFTVTDDNDATATDNVSIIVKPAAINQKPIAEAGEGKILFLPTNTVTLIGSGSDADGSIASYLWEKINGPAVTFATVPTASSVSLSALVAGDYVFQLTVTDDKGASGSDLVSVNVIAANQSPTALAGIDINLTWPTNSTNIVGSGSDPDGSISAYAWSQVGGPVVTDFQNTNSSTVTYSNLEEAKTYTFRLTVTDNKGATGIDDVKVIVSAAPVNNPPVAIAGDDQSIALPINSIILNGSGTDSDGSITGYSWVKINGPDYTPANENTASLTASNLKEGTYVFQLTVTDNKGAVDTDDVSLIVQPEDINEPPVANAGDDVVLTAPANSTTLTGSGTDKEDLDLTYAWKKLSGTDGTLTGENTSILQLTELLPGKYTFQLTVTDTEGGSDTDEVSVTINNANIPPTASAGLDISITSPASATPITGSGTDVDGSIDAYLWEYVSGSPGGPPTLVNENTNTVTVSDLLEGTYLFRLTVTDNTGAIGTDEVKVIINAAANQSPVANAGNNKSITLPTSTENFTGTGTDTDGVIATYLWTNISKPPTSSLTLSNENTNTLTVADITIAGPYVFNLTVTDDDGASSSDEVTLIVKAIENKPPIVSAGDNQSIKLPINSVNLTSTVSDEGEVSYKWSFVGGPLTPGLPTNLSTSGIAVADLNKAGTYEFSLTVKDSQELTATDNVFIFVSAAAVNQTPIANAGKDQVLSLLPPPNETTPLSTTLFGIGSDADKDDVVTYVWSQISGPPIPNPQPDYTLANVSLIDKFTIAGDYVFQLTVSDGKATATDNVTIKVNAATVNHIPVANAGKDQSITLPTKNVTLNGSGSDADIGDVLTYLWTKVSGQAVTLPGVLTQPKLQLSNLDLGQYTFRLEVTDNKGASHTDDVKVFVNAPTNHSPIVTVEKDKVISLPVVSTTLTGSATDVDINDAITYIWKQVTGPNTAALINATTTTLTANNLIAGIYSFRLTATDKSNATDSKVVQVTVNEGNEPPIVDGGDDVIVNLKNGNSTQLNAIGTDPEGKPLTYLWEKISGPTYTSTGVNPITLENLVEGSYQFKITVTDIGGEQDVDLVDIEVLPAATNIPPTVSAGDDISIQLPENSVTLNGVVTDDGETTASWTQLSGPDAILTPNSNSLSITDLTEGTYVFKFTATEIDQEELSDSDEVSIEVTAASPTPFVKIEGDQIIQLPTNTITLEAKAESPNGLIQSYKWEVLGNPVTIQEDSSNVFEAASLTVGKYTFRVTVKDELDQLGFDDLDVEVMAGPSNSFSPNDDGSYDTWLIGETDQFTDADIKVYNRQGLKVFQSTGYSIPWDGTLNSKALPEGVYFYVIRKVNEKPKTGSVTIIR